MGHAYVLRPRPETEAFSFDSESSRKFAPVTTLFAFRNTLLDLVKIPHSNSQDHFARLEHPVSLGDKNNISFSRRNDGALRHRDTGSPGSADDNVGIHVRFQFIAWIRKFKAGLDGSRCGINGRIDEDHSPAPGFPGLIRQS